MIDRKVGDKNIQFEMTIGRFGDVNLSTSPNSQIFHLQN